MLALSITYVGNSVLDGQRVMQVFTRREKLLPLVTISATANTNSGRSNIDSAFLGQGWL